MISLRTALALSILPILTASLPASAADSGEASAASAAASSEAIDASAGASVAGSQVVAGSVGAGLAASGEVVGGLGEALMDPAGSGPLEVSPKTVIAEPPPALPYDAKDEAQGEAN